MGRNDFTFGEELRRLLFAALLPDRGRNSAQLAQWLEMPEHDLRKWLEGPPSAAYSPESPATSRAALRVIRRIIEEDGFRIQKKRRLRIQRAHQRQTATPQRSHYSSRQ